MNTHKDIAANLEAFTVIVAHKHGAAFDALDEEAVERLFEEGLVKPTRRRNGVQLTAYGRRTMRALGLKRGNLRAPRNTPLRSK